MTSQRRYIRRMIIKEIARRHDDYLYSELEGHIANSNFWLHNNNPHSTDFNSVKGNWIEQTDAAFTLGQVIQQFFDSKSFPITILVRTPDADDNPKTVIAPGHKNYPDKIAIGGEQGLSEKGRFLMYINLGTHGSKFNTDDINPANVSSSIARIIRHELIHADQFEKRRKSQKISRVDAKNRYQDEGEIPDSTLGREKYLGSKIEIDAYAMEFAEELLEKFGKDKSLEILRGNIDISNIEISDQLREYFVDFENSNFTKRLKGKIYSNIVDLTDRGIYAESKKSKKRKKVGGSQPEETYESSTIKNLYLDQPTSHGGWPEGPSKSYMSNKPVNKQIADYLKSMGLVEESLREVIKDIIRQE
jgi:hypothetical protein